MAESQTYEARALPRRWVRSSRRAPTSALELGRSLSHQVLIGDQRP
jgi:hypothetical protein